MLDRLSSICFHRKYSSGLACCWVFGVWHGWLEWGPYLNGGKNKYLCHLTPLGVFRCESVPYDVPLVALPTRSLLSFYSWCILRGSVWIWMNSNIVRFIEGQTRFSTSYQACTKNLPNMEGVICKTTNSRSKDLLNLSKSIVFLQTFSLMLIKPRTGSFMIGGIPDHLLLHTFCHIFNGSCSGGTFWRNEAIWARPRRVPLRNWWISGGACFLQELCFELF